MPVVDWFFAGWQGKAISVNQWTRARSVNGKAFIYKTKEYRQFVDDLALCFKTLNQKMKAGYVDAIIYVSLWKMRDSDSVVKPVLDALEVAGVIEDDRYVRHVKIMRLYHKRDALDSIEVSLVGAPPP